MSNALLAHEGGIAKPEGVNAANIPQVLKDLPRWTLWRYQDTGKAKPDKVPFQVDGTKASPTNHHTWYPFTQVLAALEAGGFDGINFALAEGDGITGIDLDTCRDPGTGEVEPWARAIVDDMGSYAEVSPSGTGLRIFVRGSVPEGCKAGRIEIYSTNHFLSVTGRHVTGTPTTVEDAQGALTELWGELKGPQAGPGARAAKVVTSEDIDWNADPETIRPWLEEALACDPQFARTWNHQRTDMQDSSDSAYDLSLTSQAVLVHGAIDPTRLYLLIRLHREERCTNKKKGTRKDYVLGRINLALANLNNGHDADGAGGVGAVGGVVGEILGSGNLAHLDPSDTGNAERLLANLGRDLLWTPHAGWYVWDDQRWRQDDCLCAVKLAQQTAKAIFDECKYLADRDAQKARVRWAVASQNKARIDGMLAMAKPHVAVTNDRFDTDPWLFNVANGTLDLGTGELLPHRRVDRITKLAPVPYDPDADAPRWRQFLWDIFAGDEDLIRFMRRAVGYSLTGEISEQVMFILHGETGSNGKSTFLEVLAALVGDYGQQTPIETLMVKERGGGIPNDVARLCGARFVSAVEPERYRRLAESLIKQATGGDRMSARFLHREWFEFVPTFKLWLATNPKPEVSGTDDAIWRRLRMIPFAVKFWHENDPKRPDGAPLVDVGLKHKLLEELPGILAWAVRGCLEWREYGLKEPEQVLAATAQYRAEMDRTGEFIEACCIVGPDCSAFFSHLYGIYEEWAQDSGYDPMSKKAFGQALRSRGYQEDKGAKGVRIYRGLAVGDTSGLKPPKGPPQSDPVSAEEIQQLEGKL